MKKYLIVMMFITINFIYGQDTTSQETTTMEEELLEVSWYTRYRMDMTGYKSFEEYKYNTYYMLTLGTPLIGIVTDNTINSFPILSLEFNGLMHHKNKFYIVCTASLSFSWENSIAVMVGLSYGIGGSFFDGRNDIGQGWLAGMDIELGYRLVFNFNTIEGDEFFSGVVLTGLNFRGMYRSVGRTGVNLGFQILYEYYLYNTHDRHGFSITPKIGLVF